MKLWNGEEILVYFQTACIDVLAQLLLEKKRDYYACDVCFDGW